ncbi:MAG: extracellular solute-binding protein [Nitriliruptoraceae bacterium]
MHLSRRTRLLAAMAALLLAVTACGGTETTEEAAATTADDDTATDDGAGEGDAAQTVTEDDPLTVYLNPFGPVLTDAFTEETGIPAEIADVSGGEVLARIAAEGDNPQWDVLVLDGAASVEGLDQQGLLYTGWEPDGLDNLNELGRANLPDSLGYFPVGVHAAAIIAYNVNEVEDPPTDFSALADPAYRDRIGFADPAIAAPAYPFVSYFFDELGMEDGRGFFEDVFDNGLKVYEKNGPVGQALISGDIHIAALQEQNAVNLANDGEPVGFLYPQDGAPASVRVVAISAGTDKLEAAQRFVEFMLDPETQTYLMNEPESGDDGVYTATLDGVDAPEYPGRPAEVEFAFADLAFAAENEAEIKQFFADQAVR